MVRLGFLAKKFLTHFSKRYASNLTCEQLKQIVRAGEKVSGYEMLKVPPYGNFNIKVPIHCVVESLSPQEYPDMDQMIISFVGTNSDSCNKTFRNMSMDISENSDGYDITMEPVAEMTDNLVVHIQLPIKANINLNVGESSLIQSFESDIIKITAKQINFSGVKAGNVKATSTDGGIFCEKLLQGNLNLCSNKGDIVTNRIQGTNISCAAMKGNIKIDSLYSETAALSCTDGNMLVSNCHSNTEVMVKSCGDLSMSSLEGCLNAVVESGKAELFVTKPENINLLVKKGDIELKVDNKVNAKCNLRGKLLSFHSGFKVLEDTVSGDIREIKGTLGESSNNKLEAITLDGSVSLLESNWFLSLNL